MFEIVTILAITVAGIFVFANQQTSLPALSPGGLTRFAARVRRVVSDVNYVARQQPELLLRPLADNTHQPRSPDDEREQTASTESCIDRP